MQRAPLFVSGMLVARLSPGAGAVAVAGGEACVRAEAVGQMPRVSVLRPCNLLTIGCDIFDSFSYGEVDIPLQRGAAIHRASQRLP